MVEIRRPNDGRDPFPILLKRCKLPKTPNVPPVGEGLAHGFLQGFAQGLSGMYLQGDGCRGGSNGTTYLAVGLPSCQRP